MIVIKIKNKGQMMESSSAKNRRYCSDDRRVNSGKLKPTLYLIIELMLLGEMLYLIQVLGVATLNSSITMLAMAAFGAWSLKHIYVSILPRYKRVLNRQGEDYPQRRVFESDQETVRDSISFS